MCKLCLDYFHHFHVIFSCLKTHHEGYADPSLCPQPHHQETFKLQSEFMSLSFKAEGIIYTLSWGKHIKVLRPHDLLRKLTEPSYLTALIIIL